MKSDFTLSFGKTLDNYILRLNEIKTIKDSFMDDGMPIQIYIISGIKGSGKTTFLKYIREDFSSLDDWLVIDLNGEKELLESFASELYANNKVKQMFLKKRI